MKKTVLIILALMFAFPSIMYSEEIIKKGEVLNLERCVEIAIKKHPSVVAAGYTANASQSRVEEAKANYYPQVDWSSAYSRILPVTGASGSISSGSSSGTAGAARHSFDQYTSSVTLKQNIYDFGKTSSQVRVQNFNLDSAKADLDNAVAQVILNVKQAYYSLLKAERNKVVSEEAVRQFQQHLEQAKGFFEAGTKPKFDVTKAEVDLSNANLNLIKAENALRVAIVTLNNAMGIPYAPEYIVEDNLSFQKYEITFEDAVEKAFRNRSDLQSVIAKKKAFEESINLAKKGYMPALSGNAAYTWSAEKFPLEEGWNAGVTLTFPIFSGFLTKNQVKESEANLNVAKANEESMKQDIYLDIQQSYLNLRQAEDSIAAAELTVKQATENFDIANGRYAAGVGNPIEVTDAEVSLSNAKTAYIQALYDYRVARASMEKAMGTDIKNTP